MPSSLFLDYQGNNLYSIKTLRRNCLLDGLHDGPFLELVLIFQLFISPTFYHPNCNLFSFFMPVINLKTN